MSKLLTNRVKTTNSNLVPEDRYEFLKLADAEPNLGVPTDNNSVFASDAAGSRVWLSWNDGLVIDGTNINVDATVVRTFGTQTVEGNKIFSDALVVNASLTVTEDATFTGIIDQSLTANRVLLAGSGGRISDHDALTFDAVNFIVGQGAFVVNSATGNISTQGDLLVEKDTDLNGNLTINENKFTVESITGDTAVGGSLFVKNTGFLEDTSQSTSVSTGSMVISGGLGIAKNINIGEDATIIGNAVLESDLAVIGDTTLGGVTADIQSTNLLINDPVPRLGISGLTETDSSDRGFEFSYYDTEPRFGFFGVDLADNFFTFIPDADKTSKKYTGTLGSAKFLGVVSETLTATDSAAVELLDVGTVQSDNFTENRIIFVDENLQLADSENLEFNGQILDVGGGNFTVESATGDTFIEGVLELYNDFSLFNESTVQFSINSQTGSVTINGDTQSSGTVELTANLSSNSFDSGTLVVTGGVGIGGDINTSGNIDISNGTGKFVSNVPSNQILYSVNGELSGSNDLIFDNEGFKTNTAFVTNLGNNRIVTVGTNGELLSDSKFTYDGIEFKVGDPIVDQFVIDTITGNVNVANQITSVASVSGSYTTTGIASVGTAKVDDLSANRIVFVANSDGTLADSELLSFDTDFFAIGVDRFVVDANTGDVTVKGSLDVDNDFTVFSDPSGIAFAVDYQTGNTLVGGTLDIDGNTTVNGSFVASGNATITSLIIQGLPQDRIPYIGANNIVISSPELSFNGSQFIVGQTLNVFNIDSSSGNTTIGGNLTVNGSVTYLNSSLDVADSQIVLGKIPAPTDASADTGGMVLRGTTDKTFLWSQATNNWTSSEHIDLAAGKTFKIQDQMVLSSTELGSAVTKSSLTEVGNVSQGIWQASVIGPAYGGTGINNGTSTITVAGNFETAGGHSVKFNTNAATELTLPAAGTLTTLTGAEVLTNKTISAGNNSISDLTNSNLSGNAGITNANLANDSVTLGTSTVALGQTLVNIQGVNTIDAFQINVTNLRLQGNKIRTLVNDTDLLLEPAGTGTVNVQQSRITQLLLPQNPSDAANKEYVDEVAQGLIARPSVLVATTDDLLASFDSLNGVLTIPADGSTQDLEVDGTLLTQTGLTLLVKDQLNQEENGIYVLTQVGNEVTDWQLTRCSFCEESSQIPGSFVFVTNGDINQATGWVLTVDNKLTFTINVDPIIVVQFSGEGVYKAGIGLTLDGNVFNVNSNLSHVTGLGTITQGEWQGDIVQTQYGGTGHSVYTNGQLLIGNELGSLSKATLTAGTGIAVNNASGSVEIVNTDLGSAQNIFKNVKNQAQTVEFSASSNNDSIVFVAGTGLDVAFNDSNNSVTYSHSDTSSATSTANTDAAVIQNIDLDQFGHVTATATVDLDNRYYTKTQADDRYVNVTGDTMTGFLTLHAEPSSLMHAATKAYVDFSVQGFLQIGEEVAAATDQHLDASYSNGTGVLTANNVNDPLFVDGENNFSVGDGILVKTQNNPAHNGSYLIIDLGSVSTPWVLERNPRSIETRNLAGQYTFVKGGGTFAGTGWVADIGDPLEFDLGQDPIEYFQFSGAGTFTAGDGLSLVGLQYSHANTSNVEDLVPVAKTYVNGIEFDQFGHVTAVSTATETFVTALDFNTSTGLLQATRQNDSVVTVNLDGRYLFITDTTDQVEEGDENLYHTTERVEDIIDNRVTKTFVDNLGIDAVSLGGELPSYYLDWNNVTNKPPELQDVIEITVSLTLTGDWQNTGINGIDLDTGTYAVQLYANDVAIGGVNNNEYYSGTMSWFSGTTADSPNLPNDEIVLHRAGASGAAGLFLRTFRENSGTIQLQINSTVANSSSAAYVFKFKRLI